MKCSCPWTRRDKYEKDKIEYWVEEETKGSYTISQKESWKDTREIDATEDLDGQALPGDDDDDSDDGQDGASSESSAGSSGSDSSTKGKKRKRGGNKGKKEKKEKKTKKAKKSKKDKKSKKPRSPVSSPSSKAGTPAKDNDALEEEARSEAPVVN